MARNLKVKFQPPLALFLIGLVCARGTALHAQEVLSTPCENMNTIWEDSYGDLGIGWGYGTSRLWYAGEEVWFTLGEPAEGEPKKIHLLIKETEESPLEVVAEADFPGTVSYTFESHRFVDEVWVEVDWEHAGPRATLLDVGCDSTGTPQPFPISLGVNDAWYEPDLDGHGVLLTVYPSIRHVFLALFTFDTESYTDNGSAILGDAGQRWLTAFGPYEGNAAQLDIDLTVGGVFLQAEPMPVWLPGGSIDLTLKHCNRVTLNYDVPSIDRQGSLDLQRVANDRVELCERLSVTDDE